MSSFSDFKSISFSHRRSQGRDQRKLKIVEKEEPRMPPELSAEVFKNLGLVIEGKVTQEAFDKWFKQVMEGYCGESVF